MFWSLCHPTTSALSGAACPHSCKMLHVWKFSWPWKTHEFPTREFWNPWVILEAHKFTNLLSIARSLDWVWRVWDHVANWQTGNTYQQSRLTIYIRVTFMYIHVIISTIWVFPKMVVPPKHPKMVILVGKPRVVGYHHFRKPPYQF